MKKISIIIPAYNVENYIKDTIESINSNDFDDYEVIIINDGSTDNTLQIIEELIKDDKRYSIINQTNLGLSYARKVGLNHATGEYIYFCDGDDMLTSDALKFMYDNAKKYDLDVLMTNAVFKNEINNEWCISHDGQKIVSKDMPSYLLSGEELLDIMIKNREWRYAVWLYLVKRKILDNIEFYKDVIHEDAPYNYQLLNIAKRVKYFDKIVYKYRLRENSLMSKKTSIKNIIGYINAYQSIYKYNNEHFPNNHLKYSFEIRMIDQIIETYQILKQNEKKAAENLFYNIKDFLNQREYYHSIDYKELFKKK